MYTSITYDSQYIFYSLSAATGSATSTGIIKSAGPDSILDIKEANGNVILATGLGTSLIVIINPENSEVLHEFSQTDIRIEYIAVLTQSGYDYLYLAGTFITDEAYLAVKSYPENLIEFPQIGENTITWSNISANYLLEDLPLNTISAFTYTTRTTASAALPSAIDISSDLTSATQFVRAALWNDDLNQTVRQNSTVVLDFLWS